ncbi:MAG: hypothetical protein ABH864_01065 [archaeon]
MDSQEFVERNIILLLGQDEMGATLTHLQKEMFALSEIKGDLKEDLNFEKHYLGPYSRVISETVQSPSYFSDMFGFEGGRIFLSDSGKRIYEEMLKDNLGNEEFLIFISSLKVLRKIYESLSERELLFLVYETYPEYKKNSAISDSLLREPRRSRILSSLLRKEIITEERFKELENG